MAGISARRLPRERAYEPFYDIERRTSTTAQSFGRRGWFWWRHRRVLSGTVWRLVPFSLQLPPRISAPDVCSLT